jgi:alpha-L-fucosidase
MIHDMRPDRSILFRRTIRNFSFPFFVIGLLSFFNACTPEPRSVEALREDFLGWGFGMFIHFNMATFNEREWANGHEDPATFAPDRLDCGQWADAAAAAGMKYAVLTVKHTGGWCLWDSQYTDSHDATAFTNFRDGQGDIVREFVEAFRSRGIKVGLYYCMPGNYNNKWGNQLREGQVSLEGMPPEARGRHVEFIQNQLTELLTGYGTIDLLWFDQVNKPTVTDHIPEIIRHVKSIQPECLVVSNNTHDFSRTDIFSYEYPFMKDRDLSRALPPEGNRNPGEVSDYLGPAWFWKKDVEWNLKSAGDVVEVLRACNERRANYLLNVAPDTSGRIPETSVERLREVGALLSNKPKGEG